MNGRVFLRIKRCPLCLLTNSDANPLKAGPLGADVQDCLPWHRGTTEDPESRFDRICTTAYDLGGFCSEYDSPDDLIVARKEKPEVAAEWDAARGETIQLMENDSAFAGKRMGAAQKKAVAKKLLSKRKKTVEAYKKSQMEVKRKFRGVLKSKIVKRKGEGYIQRKNIKVQSLMIAGKWQEVCLIPKLPDGEFEVDAVDIVGAEQREIHDDGEAVVRENQGEVKFRKLAEDAVAGAEEAMGANTNIDIDKDSEGASSEHSEAIGASSDESEDDLGHGSSSLFASASSAALPSQHKSAVTRVSSPAGKAPKARSAKPAGVRPPQASPLIPLAAVSLAASPRAADGGMPAEQKAAAQDDAPGTAGRMSFAAKHAGKSPEEVLDAAGLSKVKEQFEPVKTTLETPPFTTAVLGADYTAYVAACTSLRKSAKSLQTAAVNFDIKVKKWKDVSTELLDISRAWRNKVAQSISSPSKPRAIDPPTKFELATTRSYARFSERDSRRDNHCSPRVGPPCRVLTVSCSLQAILRDTYVDMICDNPWSFQFIQLALVKQAHRLSNLSAHCCHRLSKSASRIVNHRNHSYSFSQPVDESVLQPITVIIKTLVVWMSEPLPLSVLFV